VSADLEYRLDGYRRFWNGHREMVEVWGTSRTDGQAVRYFQPALFFGLRLSLYLLDHPDASLTETLHHAANATLTQPRASWNQGERHP